MKRILWISILTLSLVVSCTNESAPSPADESKTNYSQETISAGIQFVQLSFSSEQPFYRGKTALPTKLEIENLPGQPVYLPWGTDPRYNLIVIGLDSSYRTTFGITPPTPEAVVTDYSSIQPGERVTSEFSTPIMPEPGGYSVCSAIFLIEMPTKIRSIVSILVH